MQQTASTTASTTQAEIPAWFPAVEVNQGAISIAALIFALIAFLFETHRANNASKHQREEFRKALIAVCDEMQTSLVEGDWPYATRMAPRVVNALLNAPPPAPKLISAAVDFVIQTENQQGPAMLNALGEGFVERQSKIIDDWRQTFRDA